MSKKITLDFDVMRNICLADLEAFKQIPNAQVTETKNGPLIFIDRQADILGIAHLDSTPAADNLHHFYRLLIGKDDVVFAARLDDRLGAYIILDLLPKMGFKIDILLTWGEESGNSTAQFFEPKKKYKWMFQFDRMGNDVVHYQYGTEELKKSLRAAGFDKISHGAISDISYMEHMGCKGFNVGVGYEDYHSAWARADMNVVRSQVAKFKTFYHQNKRKFWKHEEKKAGKPVSKNYNYGYGDEYDYWGRNSEFYSSHVWDRQIGKYVLKPEPTASVVEHPSWTTQHKNGKTICAGDTCMVCEQLLKPADANSPYYGVCQKCEIRVKECLICSQVTLIQDLHPHNGQLVEICDPCYENNRRNFDVILTDRFCPRCNNAMFIDEVLEGGDCKTCRKYPDIEWWREGVDVEKRGDGENEEEEFPFG